VQPFTGNDVPQEENPQRARLPGPGRDLFRRQGRRKPVLYSLLDNIRFMGKRDFFSLAVFVVCAFNQLAFLFWGAVFALSAMFIYILSGKMSLPGEKAPA